MSSRPLCRPLRMLLLRGAKPPSRPAGGVGCRYVHTGRPSNSLLWLSREREGGAARNGISSPAATRAPSRAASKVAAVDATPSPSSPASPPLLLDPPFTPVPGESEALRQRVRGGEPSCLLLYVCGTCNSPLFCSAEYAASSSLGRHSSGWPSFIAPVCSSVLRLRSLLQRSAVQEGGRAPLAATLAARGLRVEGEMLRQPRGGGCARSQPRTWREACLRDVNKRSDPTVLEGCCSGCGRAVCRVVTERRSGVKYVVNPTAVKAELTECSGPGTASTPRRP
ncbi:uncharacterized protein Tco025E_05858 [Trypanosoma conorhini]|uniref:Uncharacterized protein n=1 Tax=Trypanosoma conorhini TaxID=83891 RepID=A0A3R7MG77_9TRYP|nr:uncharacterized protein Tco025E_05858 [Trypanosoma conorhini]RNF14550.1 hypothetical protein Tco025E_05858 [Trypanosoma conorhini]